MHPRMASAPTAPSRTSESAFSLVELSIVLVIIGLLVGGVLTGRNLIHNAQIQSVVAQKEEFVRAVSTFRQRYNGLPGDITNATQIWGAAAAAASCNNMSTVSTSTETCNGNGNQRISSYEENADAYERHRAWQHLANAGLISGRYTGVKASAANWHVRPGINSPSNDISGVGWTLFYVGTQEGDAWLFDGSYDHVLFAGKESANSSTNMPFLTPDEAWALDSKYDDGKPARGSMVSKYGATNCYQGVSGTTDFDATYRLSYKQAACMFIFRNLF